MVGAGQKQKLMRFDDLYKKVNTAVLVISRTDKHFDPSINEFVEHCVVILVEVLWIPA